MEQKRAENEHPPFPFFQHDASDRLLHNSLGDGTEVPNLRKLYQRRERRFPYRAADHAHINRADDSGGSAAGFRVSGHGSKTLGSLLAFTGFPAEAVPYVIVRLFSSSAATSLVLDIFKTKGPDSHVGMLVSVLAGCTETVFYTMSVYFMSIKVTKTRYTLAGALTATAAGIAASVFLVQTL